MTTKKEQLTRMQQKHDIEVNWLKAINFIPMAAEIIVYDPDEVYNYARFKCGDGVTYVNDLPFIIDTDETLSLEGRIADAKATGEAINSIKSIINDFYTDVEIYLIAEFGDGTRVKSLYDYIVLTVSEGAPVKLNIMLVDELPDTLIPITNLTGPYNIYVVRSTGIAYGDTGKGAQTIGSFLGGADRGWTDDINAETDKGIYSVLIIKDFAEKKDITWENLPDKPFGEIIENFGDTITWDGNIDEDNDVVTNTTSPSPGTVRYIKVASAIPTIDDIGSNSILKFLLDDGNEQTAETIDIYQEDNGIIRISSLLSFVVIIPTDNIEWADMIFPEKGVYFMQGFDADGNVTAYCTSFTIPNYNFGTKTILKKIDEKYLPIFDTVKSENIEVGDTLTWDGNIDGKTYSGYASSSNDVTYEIMYIRISNSVPTIEDLETNGWSITTTNGDTLDSDDPLLGDTNDTSGLRLMEDDLKIYCSDMDGRDAAMCFPTIVKKSWNIHDELRNKDANITLKGAAVLEPGVYFLNFNVTYSNNTGVSRTQSFTLNNYNFLINSTKKIIKSELISVDNTLTQEGISADAKTVGEKFVTKVDKIDGKQLSTNDFTTEEKNKLSGIADGAEVNVQSDWSVTDSSSDAFIKNKPTIPTKSSWNYDDSYIKYTAAQSLTNEQKSQARSNIGAGTSNFSGSYTDLTNKPTIPTVNNGTFTIQKNGITINTFTANSPSDVTANITVPTKVSELINDSDFKTTDDNTTYNLTASANAANGQVKLNLTASGSGDGIDQVTIKGSGATTVTTDSSGIITINSSEHPTALKNPNALTIGGKTYDGSSAVNVDASDLGIANAMHFIGETSTVLIDGSDTAIIMINGESKSPVNGDVVLYQSKEFVWQGLQWKELGDGSSHALKTITITAGNGLTGGGDLSANRTLAIGQGDGITVSSDSIAAKAGNGIIVNSIGINHADTSSQASITADGRKYITGITLDEYGHVTNLTTGTETVTIPNSLKNPNVLTIKGNGTQSFTYDGSEAKTLNIKAGTNININSDTSGNVTINGNTLSAAAGENIGTTGTPSVVASTSNGVTTFTFNYLKGATGGKGDKGDQGGKGDKGDPGYTPIRGVDYWTDADKNEIKQYVNDAILGGEW